MCYKAAMRLNSALAVRFSQNTRDRLEAVARRANLKASDLVREAVDRYLLEVDRSGEAGFKLSEEAPKARRAK